MSTLQEITSVEDWQKVVASATATTTHIIYFHAPWAAPCENITKVLTTLAAEYPVTDPPTTRWTSINAEEVDDLAIEFDVSVVPYIIIWRDGVALETISGSNAAKATASIKSFIDKPATSELTPTNGAAQPEVSLQEEAKDPEAIKKELWTRLGDLVKAAPVMLFMKGTPSEPKCGFSKQTVAILREHSVKYGFFNILADDDVRQGLKEYAEWPTFPQLWIDGELVGGLDIVKEEIANNTDFLKPYSTLSAEVAGP